jgi:hypothetical protein
MSEEDRSQHRAARHNEALDLVQQLHEAVEDLKQYLDNGLGNVIQFCQSIMSTADESTRWGGGGARRG